MFQLLTIISSELQGFGTWWLTELRGLIPSPLTKNRRKHRPCVVLTLEGAEVALSKRARGHEQRLGTAMLTAPGQVEALRALLRRERPHDRRVALRLGSRQGLRRMLDLPLAARDDIGELLRLEMDRLSPFAADQVQFAYRVIASDPVNRRIEVELQMAPKRVIDQALAIAARFELVPESVELAAAGADPQPVLNLLPRQPKETSPSLLDYVTVGASALVIAAAIGVPLHQERSAVRELERQAAAARGAAEESLAMIKRLDEIRSQIDFLRNRKSKKPLGVEVVDELTRLIPDEAHIIQLTLHGEEVQLQGFAQDAAQVIRLLGGSTLFREPRFLSPITLDPVQRTERFHIGVALAEAN